MRFTQAKGPSKATDDSTVRWTAVRSCPRLGSQPHHFRSGTDGVLSADPGPSSTCRPDLDFFYFFVFQQSINGALSVLTHCSELFREMGALESNPPADSAKEGLVVKPAALHSAIG